MRRPATASAAAFSPHYLRRRVLELATPATRSVSDPLAEWAVRRIRLEGVPSASEGTSTCARSTTTRVLRRAVEGRADWRHDLGAFAELPRLSHGPERHLLLPDPHRRARVLEVEGLSVARRQPVPLAAHDRDDTAG